MITVMKTMRMLPLLLLFVLGSCSSVQVASDYDTKADFSRYKTYAYHKNAIDKAEISDLDKKRILRAIDDEMIRKGFEKSDNPDLLISFFTRANDQVNVNQWGPGWGWGWGWGWGPGFWGSTTTVSTSTEGTLIIDLVDAKTKDLLWQGEGRGLLTRQAEKKEEKIREFVSKILAQYPPGAKK